MHRDATETHITTKITTMTGEEAQGQRASSLQTADTHLKHYMSGFSHARFFDLITHIPALYIVCIY